MHPPLPRATCPVCKRDVALRNGGILREHRTDAEADAELCPASGFTVEQAAADVEEARAEMNGA